VTPAVYNLKYPVEFDGVTVSEIKISRPKGKHIKKLGGSSKLADVMGIAHHITEYTDGFYDELDAADYLGVAEVIGDFLDNGQ